MRKCPSRTKSYLAASVTSVSLAVIILTPSAASFSSYANAWNNIYPNSLTNDNVVGGTGSACQMCHRNTPSYGRG